MKREGRCASRSRQLSRSPRPCSRRRASPSGGLAADLLSGGPLGAFAVASLPPVAAIGLGERPSPRPLAVLVGASFLTAAAFVAGILYVGALALAGTPVPDVGGLAIQIGGGAIFTGALAIATYPIARWLARSTEKQASF